jgi:hypothetical protein
MFQRLDGVREAKPQPGFAFTPFILQKSRMRRRARTDLCGGRSVRNVPTATLNSDSPQEPTVRSSERRSTERVKQCGSAGLVRACALIHSSIGQGGLPHHYTRRTAYF